MGHIVTAIRPARVVFQMDETDVDYPVIEPDSTKIDRLVSGIQRKFGLDLVGIDIIIESRTGRYGVIDINAFPGGKLQPATFSCWLLFAQPSIV